MHSLAKFDIASKQVMNSEVYLMKFGFIGLGQMGAPMAMNLAQKHDVLVYDQNENTIAKIGRASCRERV